MNVCRSSKKFVSDSLTHLYHTDAYQLLNDIERVHYNQLFGLMACEQFLVFETLLLKYTIARLKRSPRTDRQTYLILNHLETDEQQHSAMFRTYIHAQAPTLYRNRELQFVSVRPLHISLVKRMTTKPLQSSALFWYNLLIEDYSLSFARSLAESSNEDLDAEYTQMHQEHSLDEQQHVHIDKHVITHHYDPQSQLRKQLDMFILNQWMCSMRSPKLAGCRIIGVLCAIHNRLRPHKQELMQAVKNLSTNKNFQHHFLNPQNCPTFWQELQARPEAGALLRKQESYL